MKPKPHSKVRQTYVRLAKKATAGANLLKLLRGLPRALGFWLWCMLDGRNWPSKPRLSVFPEILGGYHMLQAFQPTTITFTA